MSRNLTERQEKFIEFLFGEANGDVNAAKALAGYSDNVAACKIFNSKAVCEAVIERSQSYIALHTPKAVMSTVGIIDNPTELGAAIKLAAAKEIMDRGGVSKTERMEIDTGSSAVFILPPKKEEESYDEQE